MGGTLAGWRPGVKGRQHFSSCAAGRKAHSTNAAWTGHREIFSRKGTHRAREKGVGILIYYLFVLSLLINFGSYKFQIKKYVMNGRKSAAQETHFSIPYGIFAFFTFFRG